MSYLLLIVLISISLSFCFLESRLRQLKRQKLAANSSNVLSSHRKLLETRLCQIPNPPFNVKDFLADLDKYYSLDQGLTQKLSGTRASTNFSSQHINIFDGIRRGIKPESKSSRTMYVLGGSTVSCLEGPDEWTLPSQLQKELNESKIQIEVINVGVSGATTFDRFVAASELIETKPGDFLLFWFGVNEGKGLWGRRGRGFLKYWPGFAEILDLVQKKSKSILLNWVYIETVNFDETAHQVLAKHRAAVLRKLFDEKEDYWAKKGVSVIACLQPTIFSTKAELSTREFLAQNWKPEMQIVMNIQYCEFNNSFKGADYYFDFSDSTIMDNDNSFVDWVHLSWRGNQVVAGYILQSGILNSH